MPLQATSLPRARCGADRRCDDGGAAAGRRHGHRCDLQRTTLGRTRGQSPAGGKDPLDGGVRVSPEADPAPAHTHRDLLDWIPRCLGLHLHGAQRGAPGRHHRGRPATGRGANLLTMVDALLGAPPGESLRLQGWWSSHPQHGRQFEVASYLDGPARAIQGIRHYLGSGLVRVSVRCPPSGSWSTSGTVQITADRPIKGETPDDDRDHRWTVGCRAVGCGHG